MRIFSLAAAFLLILPPPSALAWGNKGHRIIADIAWDRLDESTRENLRPFLGNNDLASVATWADDVRSERAETAPWHYVDIPPDAAGYDARDCPNDDCVVAQINRFARILGDRGQPFTARKEALNFLVHFVGDLSQPMHTMADARGGNDIPVTFFGSAQCGQYPCNLHSVWDTQLIEQTGLREHLYASQLEAMISAEHLAGGSTSPVDWANQSLQLGKTAWVRPQADIDEAYYVRERPVVDEQLALAGLRLAQLLQQELGTAAKL